MPIASRSEVTGARSAANQPAGASGAAAIDPAAARRAAWALYVIVIVSGAVLMGVEIAGAKLLAPGFGTSTFVWGSIIGLFMGSLALGYWLGGILADVKPSFPVLAGIVSMAGLWTALVPRFGPSVADLIAQQEFGPMLGPLIAALALFAVPSFLMGMVSPYAVKLSASSLTGLGSVAGRLYAWSTLGSIIGTLLTTFLLIPHIFLSGVMQGLGVTLMVVSVACLACFLSASRKLTRRDGSAIGVMALLALICAELWAAAPVEPLLKMGERLLHYQDSTYHEILVTEDVIDINERDPNEGPDGGTLIPIRSWEDSRHDIRRWLKFNENLESGIYPYRDQYANAVTYTDLLHLPLLWTGKPRKILVVGGGGALIPTQYHDWYQCEVDVAEIDPAVEFVARKYFKVPDTTGQPQSQQIRFHIGDGRQTLKKLKDGDYDVVVLDAYSSGGQIPFHLMTWEFMNEVKAKLSPKGVLISNIISGLRNEGGGRYEHPADLFLAEYKTLQASRVQAKRIASNDPADNAPLFKQVYVFPKVYDVMPLSPTNFKEYRNVILVATLEETMLSGGQMEAEARRLSQGSSPLVKTDLLWHVQQHLLLRNYSCPSPGDLQPLPVLCDDYAPVDTMYRPVRIDENRRPIF